MSLVLYRKYRPQNFSEVIGQEDVVKTITNSISSGVLSHAYLFSGPRGSGKTTIARLLAKAVNCQNRKGFEPCNKCSSCLEIMEGRAMDVVEIDAASYRGIDDVRELREAARFSPAKSSYKVYIIDECHQLSRDANNALLKILEEAPAQTIFVLATTELKKILPTILSRCQRYDFHRLRVPEMVKRLEMISKKEGIKIDKDSLILIANQADGAARDAESLLGQVISFADGHNISREETESILGLVMGSVTRDLVSVILNCEPEKGIEMLGKLIEKGIDLQELAKAITGHLRRLLVLKVAGEEKSKKISSLVEGLTNEDWNALTEQSKKYDEKNIKKATNIFLEAENKMKYASLQQLPLELAMIEIAEEN
jgi:DNA polymerase III subunit gamma/tau